MSTATMERAGDQRDTPARPEGLREAMLRFVGYLRDYRGCAQSTLSAYGADLRRFLEFLAAHYPGVYAPVDVTREVVMDFGLSLSGLAPRTIRRKMACISSFFNFLIDFGESQTNPARRIALPKLPQTSPRVLSEEEARQLVAAANSPGLHCLLIVLLGTGIRRGEAARMRVGDVDFEHGQLQVRGKGQKDRTLPLTEDVLICLREYLGSRQSVPSNPVFLNPWGRPLSEKGVTEVVSRLARQVGLDGITAHRLRHTFATMFIQAGGDIRMLQELLGHSNMETTGRYLHSDTRTKAAAVAQLPSFTS